MTPTGFDPYAEWLGIPPSEQPPDHYRLLGLRRFESARRVIEAAADDQMDAVYRHRAGPHEARARQLLNDLAAAKVCLCDPARKAAYDASLNGESVPNAGAPVGDVGPTSPRGWKPAPLKLNDNPTPRVEPPSASFTFPPHFSPLMPPGKPTAADVPPAPGKTHDASDVLLEQGEDEGSRVAAGDQTLDYRPPVASPPEAPAPRSTPAPGPSSDQYSSSGSSISATPSTFTSRSPAAPVMPAPVASPPVASPLPQPLPPPPLPTATPVATAIPVAQPAPAPSEPEPEAEYKLDDDQAELSQLASPRLSAVERAREDHRAGLASTMAFILQIIIGGVLGTAIGFYVLQKVRSGEWEIPYVNIPGVKRSSGTSGGN